MTEMRGSIPVECPKCGGDSGFKITPGNFTSGGPLWAFATCDACGHRMRIKIHEQPGDVWHLRPEGIR